VNVVDVRFPKLVSSRSQDLFTVVHLPSIEDLSFPFVVMCHGLGGSKVGRFRYPVHLSELLAEQGIATIRFDFRGSGDSEGYFSDTTLERCTEDLEAVINWAGEQSAFDTSRIGLFGRSFGGVIALLYAAKNGRTVSAVGVQSPPFSFDLYSDKLPSHMWFERETLFFHGEPLSQAFIDQMDSLNMSEVMKRLHQTPLLHIGGGKDAVVPAEHTKAYENARAGAQAPTQFVTLPNADHALSNISDRQTALKETCDLFISRLL